MANYRGILLQSNTTFVENSAFDLNFIIKDDNNDILEDLSNYKFRAEITDGAQELKKKDANHTGGSASQISVSGKVMTIHVDTDDTDNWNGFYECEVEMENKSSGAVYTIWKKNLKEIKDEQLDWN